MAEERTLGWLEGLTDNVKGKRVEMKGDTFLIGRGTMADIQLEDTQVSREHARLSYGEGQLTLEDQGSAHGTYVNGDPIKTAALKNGDRIRFGGSLFHLHIAQGVTAEIEAAQDDIATVMTSLDDVATELVSDNNIATVLADELDHTQITEVDTPQPVRVPPPVQAPSVAPEVSPGAREEEPKKALPGWLIGVLAGGAAVVVLGSALALANRLLTAEPELAPSGLADSLPTEVNTANDAGNLPVLTPTNELELGPTAEVSRDSTVAALPSETPAVSFTQSPTETPPSPGPTEAMTTALGGASGIAFASDRMGLPQIYYMNLADRSVFQLTDLPNGACQPAWSPDGARLAFTSPCGSNREAYIGSTIFMMDIDQAGNPGSTQPLMVSLGGGDYDPDWSPDGSQIAFTSQRTGRPQIFTVGLEGQAPFNVNDDLAHNWSPTWSGDGPQIAFLTGRGGAEEIWLVTAEGGEETRFSRSDGKDLARPDWSPDGATILFEKVIGSIPRVVAAPVADDGVRVFQVCQEGILSLQPMGEPAWSPDGLWLAFETWPGGGDHKIAIMKASCTAYEELTYDPALDFDAAWRPAP